MRLVALMQRDDSNMALRVQAWNFRRVNLIVENNIFEPTGRGIIT